MSSVSKNYMRAKSFRLSGCSNNLFKALFSPMLLALMLQRVEQEVTPNYSLLSVGSQSEQNFLKERAKGIILGCFRGWTK